MPTSETVNNQDAPSGGVSQPAPAAPQPASTTQYIPAERPLPAPTTMPGDGQDVKKGYGE